MVLNRIKEHLLPVLTLVGLLSITGLFWYAGQPTEVERFGQETKKSAPTSEIKKTGIEPELQIKVDKKTDILASWVQGNKKQYSYVSSDIMTTTTVKGIKEDITKRQSNKLFYKKSDKETIARIYGGHPFYEKKGKWYKVEYASTTIEAWEKQMDEKLDLRSGTPILIKSVYAQTTDSYYAGSGDGMVRRTSSGSWSQIIDGDGTSAYPNLATYPLETISDGGGTFSENRRSIYPFDLSGLSGVTVSSASMNLYTYDSNAIDEISMGDMNWTEITPNSYSTLQSSDYNRANWTDTILSDDNYSISTMSKPGYTSWDFNSAGITAVENALGGNWALGLRWEKDINETSYSPGSGRARLNAYYEMQSDISNDPYLEITYTEGGGTVEEEEPDRESEWFF